MKKQKIEGIGLSLRFPHFNEILKFNHNVPWFEVIVDDFLVDGPHWDKLTQLRNKKPIAMHSIGMNIGGVDPWDLNYLKKLKQLYNKFQPEWVSDHLCWSAHNGKFHHDLLPIPRTNAGLENAIDRINYLQSYFGRPLVVENVTQYIDYKQADYTEVEFINKILEKTDCYLLLDITNMIINHKNRNQDYKLFLNELQMDRIKQFHLAGGIEDNGLWIDTHTEDVKNEDITALKLIYEMGSRVPGVIERDNNLPLFSVMKEEVRRVSGASVGL